MTIAATRFEVFEVAARAQDFEQGVLHAERDGLEGATYWVARRTAKL